MVNIVFAQLTVIQLTQINQGITDFYQTSLQAKFCLINLP